MIRVEARRRRIEASFLDDLLKDASRSMLRGGLGLLEEKTRALIRWSLDRLTLTIVALDLMVTAIVFLLLAGVEGLREASLPPSLAFLFVGVVGLGAGFLLLRSKS